MKKEERAKRTKAGQLLSKFIKEIATEETEVKVEGDPQMITKAEALVRIIWKNALGYTEVIMEHDGDKLIERKHIVKPNPAYINLIYDRMEGKAGIVGEANKRPQTIADKVGEAGKARINDVVKEAKS